MRPEKEPEVYITEDGYRFVRQPDGSYYDGADMSLEFWGALCEAMDIEEESL